MNTDKHRKQIKNTVERTIPVMDIDTTKVLSDEEMDELKRQTEARIQAVKLASEVGRAGLRARLKDMMQKLGQGGDEE